MYDHVCSAIAGTGKRWYFFSDLNACNEFFDGEPLAARITAPTLVIVAAQDKMTAAVRAQEVAARISNRRVVYLERCGHSMLAEQPKVVLDALATIIRLVSLVERVHPYSNVPEIFREAINTSSSIAGHQLIDTV